MMSNTSDQSPVKLAVIVGATATGKSSLAFNLARAFNAHILSADSRQVYQGLEITSGADVPSGFDITQTQDSNLLTWYSNKTTSTKLFGISILPPTDPWATSLFREYTFSVINHCAKEQKNLIIVGGSGLYLQTLINDDPRINIPPNFPLRTALAKKSVQELQNALQELNEDFYQHMNHSDLHNPRRLVRAIEMFTFLEKEEIDQDLPTIDNMSHQCIGLQINKDALPERIRHRVIERIEQGAIQEVEHLLDRYPDQKLPAYSTTGVREIMAYLSNTIEREELIEQWTLREFKYAKRQLTWFKKRTHIEWFPATSQDLLAQVSKSLGVQE